MKKINLILICLFFCLIGSSQSIDKTWYSEKKNKCISFHFDKKCATVNEFYDVEECFRIKYKVKDDILELIWRDNKRIFPFGWNKEKYRFTIDKLEENILILTLLPYKNKCCFIGGTVWEVGRTISFKSKLSSCYELQKDIVVPD
jgi:hypothetical protein